MVSPPPASSPHVNDQEAGLFIHLSVYLSVHPSIHLSTQTPGGSFPSFSLLNPIHRPSYPWGLFFPHLQWTNLERAAEILLRKKT